MISVVVFILIRKEGCMDAHRRVFIFYIPLFERRFNHVCCGSPFINFVVAVSPGSFIGAALGGAVLGSSFTVIAFVCIRRRCKTLHNSKK